MLVPNSLRRRRRTITDPQASAGLSRVSAWRWRLALALDVAHLPVSGGFAVAGRSIVGATAWALTIATVMLAQSACAPCRLVLATEWLRAARAGRRSSR